MYPTLFHIGHLYVPTFGLLAALGLAAAITLSLRTAALAGVSPDGTWDAGLFAVIAAFAASRLLLVMFNFRSFLSAPILLLMVPSLTAAGLGLAAVSVAVYLRRHGMPVLRVLDGWAAPATLLWAFLAMGHLAEGSDPGLPSRMGLRTSLAGYPEQPVALYAAVLALTLTAGLYASQRRRRAAGWVAGVGLVLVGLVQFGLTFLRIPYRYDGETVLAMLDPLQWVALGMVVTGGVLVLWRGGEDAGVAPTRLGQASPPRSAASGRDDGAGDGLLGRNGATRGEVPGRHDGGVSDGNVIHREHSMHAHQVSEHQGSRDEMRERER